MKTINCRKCKIEIPFDTKCCTACGAKKPGMNAFIYVLRNVSFTIIALFYILIAAVMFRNPDPPRPESVEAENAAISKIESSIITQAKALPQQSIGTSKSNESSLNDSLQQQDVDIKKQLNNNLGLSFLESSKNFEMFGISFESAPLSNGEPRMIAKTTQQTSGVLIEFIGDLNDISQIGFMMEPSKDDNHNFASIACLYNLMSNVFPDWSDRQKWLIKVFNKATKAKTTEKSKQVITKGSKLIKITYFKELNLFSMVIKNKENNT